MAETDTVKDFECRRCGKCCHCGSMWRGSSHPLIEVICRDTKGTGHNDGKCAMLTAPAAGKTYCMIELWFGKEYKPDVCNEFPFVPGDCERVKQKTKTSTSESGG